MFKRVYKYLVAVVVLVLIIVLLSWGGKISTITVEGDFMKEPLLKTSAEKCLAQYNGRSFWLLSDKTVRESVLRCETIFSSATVGHSFPGGLNVTVSLVEPLVKIEKEDKSCLVFRNSATRIVLPPERCALYVLTVLEGKNIENNSFVQDFAANLVTLLNENSLSVTTIQLNGDNIAPWYRVTLSTKLSVLLPSGTNTKEKVAILVAALKGLNTAKERYSTIDLRFDMVTYK